MSTPSRDRLTPRRLNSITNGLILMGLGAFVVAVSLFGLGSRPGFVALSAVAFACLTAAFFTARARDRRP